MPFDQAKADRAVSFIENYLRHSTGETAGKPFILLPFQRQFVAELFGRVNEDGTRQYREAYLGLPRKAGKTTLVAAICAYSLFAEPEVGNQVYSVAYSRMQSGLIASEIFRMIRQNPKLSSRCRITDSTKRIVIPKYNSVYAALSSDSSNAQGLAPNIVAFDEVAEQRNMDLYEVMTSGSATRKQPLFLALGTAGITGQAPLAEYLWERARRKTEGLADDPRFLPMIHTAPPGADWTKEETWRAANPGLCPGGFVNIKELRDAFNVARQFPSAEAAFKRYHLNMWVQQAERWIPLEAFDACKSPMNETALKQLPAYIGVDLSSTTDLTAVVTVWVSADAIFARWKYFYPKEDIVQKSQQLRVPFDDWAKNSRVLQTTAGKIVDYEAVREYINKQAEKYNVKEVVYDPHQAAQLAVKLQEDGLLTVKMPPYTRFMSPACRELERLITDGALIHEGDMVTRSCFNDAAVAVGNNETMMLVKPDRRKASKRIDGVAALLVALARIVVVRGERVKRSVYEERDLLVL